MLIANKSTEVKQFTYEYMIDGPGGLNVRTLTVQVDAGENAEENAHKAFLEQLRCYGERDKRYAFNEC